MAQLQELNKTRPKGKADENLIAEITRLESTITMTRDDLVSTLSQYIPSPINKNSAERVQA